MYNFDELFEKNPEKLNSELQPLFNEFFYRTFPMTPSQLSYIHNTIEKVIIQYLQDNYAFDPFFYDIKITDNSESIDNCYRDLNIDVSILKKNPIPYIDTTTREPFYYFKWKRLKNLLRTLKKINKEVTITYSLGNNSMGFPADSLRKTIKVNSYSAKRFDDIAEYQIKINKDIQFNIPMNAVEINNFDKGHFSYEWTCSGPYDYVKFEFKPFKNNITKNKER